MLGQLGPRGASSDAGAQRTTRDKYDASVGCSAAKGPGRLRDDRLFSSDDITILVHGKWGFATTGAPRNTKIPFWHFPPRANHATHQPGGLQSIVDTRVIQQTTTNQGYITPRHVSYSQNWTVSRGWQIARKQRGAAGEMGEERENALVFF